MTAVSTILFLFVLSICNARIINDGICRTDQIEFSTKVENSSFVVYGKSIGKSLYDGSDSIFYVTFQVDCIFKGLAIERHINITNAGKRYLIEKIFARNQIFI